MSTFAVATDTSDPRDRNNALTLVKTSPQKVVVRAPRSTDRASTTLRISGAGTHAGLLITGGALPTAGQADRRGRARIEVPLRAGAANRLTVQISTKRRTLSISKTVTQLAAPGGTSELRGKVLGAGGRPLADARVRYGKRAIRTNELGEYRIGNLPPGQVTPLISASSYVSGATSAYVGPQASVRAATVRLHQVPRARHAGPAGRVLEGRGWRLSIPPNALAESTPIHVGIGVADRTLDATGLPLIEILPASLSFARPVTVAISARRYREIVGGAARRVKLSLLNPTSLAASPVRAKLSTGHITAALTSGGQLRVAPAPAPVLEHKDQCKPFASQFSARVARAQALASVNAWATLYNLQAAGALFNTYLTPGSFTAARQSVTDPSAKSEFRTAAPTQQAVSQLVTDLMAKLRSSPPPLSSPAAPYNSLLSTIGLGRGIKILWSGINTPGLIAGSRGSLIHPYPHGPVYPDARNITGDYSLIPQRDARGVRTAVKLRLSRLVLQVLDSIDFCPGGLGRNAGIYIGRTLEMSRLEQTPHPSGGMWAKPILWGLETDLDIQETDVTSLYRSNDADADGWPNDQPWAGAGYKLDNCPQRANPDQRDTNGDGWGDACGSIEVVLSAPTPAPVPQGGTASVTVEVRNTGGTTILAPATASNYAPDCSRSGLQTTLPPGTSLTFVCSTPPITESRLVDVTASGAPDADGDGAPDGFRISARADAPVISTLVVRLTNSSAAPHNVALGAGTLTVSYSNGKPSQSFPVSFNGAASVEVDAGACEGVAGISYNVAAQTLPGTRTISGSVQPGGCRASAAVEPEELLQYVVRFTNSSTVFPVYLRVTYLTQHRNGASGRFDRFNVISGIPVDFDLGVCANLAALAPEFEIQNPSNPSDTLTLTPTTLDPILPQCGEVTSVDVSQFYP